MVKNTYDHLEFALKEKGFWTPADEIRPVKGALMEFPGLENKQKQENNSIAAGVWRKHDGKQ